MVAAIAALACGDDTERTAKDDNGDSLLAYVPLAEGAVETDRAVNDDSVSVIYKTDTSMRDAAEFYRSAMSVAPWRVTRYEVDYRLGSATIVFRNDQDGVIATTRIAGGTETTVIHLDVLPIGARETPLPAASEAHSPATSDAR
ncbi:MAG: hypothetical protein WD904_05115 [Dehalococcoidia bacterium]